MSDPFKQPNPFSHYVNQANCPPSLGLFSSNNCLNHPQASHAHRAIDVNLSLNSASNLNSQYQTVPMLGQLGLGQHIAESSFRRSNLMLPGGIRPPSTVNVNIFIGNNSSVNINLLNNAPSHFTRNNWYASSSIFEPVRNNLISATPSNFKQSLLTLASNPEPQQANISGLSEIYTSPSVSALQEKALSNLSANNEQEIHTANFCLRDNVASSSHNNKQPCQPHQSNHLQHQTPPQGDCDFSFSNLLSTYLPSEKHNLFPSFLKSTVAPQREERVGFNVDNDIFREERVNPQPNLTTPESHPTMEHVREQGSDPHAKHLCLPQHHIHALPQAPMIGTQGNLQEAIILNHTINSTRVQRRQHSAVRSSSHPYTKHGPYTCPMCDTIFDSGHRFASLVRVHYKDESPAERKKRHEKKIKDRDLRIARFSAGLTVIPESLHLEGELPEDIKVSDGKGVENTKEGFAAVKIKEEIKEE